MVARRSFYTDLMPDQHLHLRPCLPYRRPDSCTVAEYEDGLIAEFLEVVEQHPDEIAALLTEPFVGSALGAAGPTPTYYQRMAAICRDHDILMISDEVMTGFGRTGRNFGCEHFGTHADILACAKGISGGYIPLGAILVRDRVAEALRHSGDPFFSGQTYSCIPLAAAVGIAVLDRIEGDGLVAQSARVGTYLKQQLRERFADHPLVGDVRGEGLFLGVEFVADRASKQILAPDLGFSKRVEAAALNQGLVVMGCRGTVDYTKGDHLLLAPPLILTEAQADQLVDALYAGVNEAAASLG
jgi:adenosylmethionine-8-amino-7-oxononanoate aminotransferase